MNTRIFKFMNRDTEIFTNNCNVLYKSLQRNTQLQNPCLKTEFIDGYTTNLKTEFIKGFTPNLF
jgi:hypothetical protein